MFRKLSRMVAAVMSVIFIPIASAHTPPEHARIFFKNLEDGVMVKSPFRLKFGIEGFGIAPADTKGKKRHTTGHHHLLTDVPDLPDPDEAIPRDENHRHYDQGETEALLELTPGEHTLQLLLGDEQHEPQDPALYSQKIRIVVE